MRVLKGDISQYWAQRGSQWTEQNGMGKNAQRKCWHPHPGFCPGQPQWTCLDAIFHPTQPNPPGWDLLAPSPTPSPQLQPSAMALVQVFLTPHPTEVSSKLAPSRPATLKPARHHPEVLWHCLLYIHPTHFLVLPGTQLSYIPIPVLRLDGTMWPVEQEWRWWCHFWAWPHENLSGFPSS